MSHCSASRSIGASNQLEIAEADLVARTRSCFGLLIAASNACRPAQRIAARVIPVHTTTASSTEAAMASPRIVAFIAIEWAETGATT
jgi:hypothetical protein